MLQRNFNQHSIGHFVQLRPKGAAVVNVYPSKWVEKCSFVFRVVSTIHSLDPAQKSPHKQGWVLHVSSASFEPKRILLDCNNASGTARLRRTLMNLLGGTAVLLDVESFLTFVAEDMRHIDRVLYTTACTGRVCVQDRVYWVFKDGVRDAHGALVADPPVLYQPRQVSLVPCMPLRRAAGDPGALMQRFISAIYGYYGARAPHAIHVLASMAKAVHRDVILTHEDGVSITNLSGPANVGKTFISVLAQCMLGCEQLVLRQCSASALLDVASSVRGMSVVWEEPRGVTPPQMCALVHEAYHPPAACTVPPSARRANSSLLIGTQTPLLGLSHTDHHLSTFTRLSHVHMTLEGTHYDPSPEMEDALKNLMPELHELFPSLLSLKYDRARVDHLCHTLKQLAPDVVDRAIRGLAVDWYFAQSFDCSNTLNTYFTQTSLQFLQRYCSRVTPFCRFCRDLEKLVTGGEMPLFMHKQVVKVFFQDQTIHECLAIYPKTYFDWAAQHMQERLSYTADMIHAALRASKGMLGEVSRNVLMTSTADGHRVQRCFVIRRDAFQDACRE